MSYRLKKALEELNPRQRETVEITEGPLLIIAGAGSGKTRALTVRIAFLIEEHKVPPESILAVTFTNKAARQMQERLQQLIPETAKLLTITTFHSFCCRLLRRWANHLGYDHGFTIYDDEDQEKLIGKIIVGKGWDKKVVIPRSILTCISQAKNELLFPQDYFPPTPDRETIRTLYSAYQEELKKNGAMDFDDLIFQTYHLLNDRKELLDKVQQRYSHFLIDEYQDTNVAQYKLSALFSGTSGNLCVVGDEDQSIYGWRGASIRNILEFEQDFPGARVVVLDQNYRSTQNILDAAGAVIKNNSRVREKRLWTEKSGGEKLVLQFAHDDRSEAEFVVSEICRLAQNKFSFKDIAVLFRMNHLSRLIEQALVKRRIPYEMTGGTKFFGRREVKDILAYLRVLHNPNDSVALRRIINVPRRGIGEATVKRLEDEGDLWKALAKRAQAKPQSKLGDFFNLILTLRESTSSLFFLAREIIDSTDYFLHLSQTDPESAEEREANIKSLLSDIRAQEEGGEKLSLQNYLEQVALHSDLDNFQEDAEKVHLLTMHIAKGLEFPVVFVMGMEEGVFPHHSSRDLPQELEEERRLAYVAMTRAMKRLYLTGAQRRMVFGTWNQQKISRFVTEIPSELFQTGFPSEAKTKTFFNSNKPKNQFNTFVATTHERIQAQFPGSPASLNNLQCGATVFHQVFGEGKVVSTEGSNIHDFRVMVFFKNAGRKNFLLQYTKLRVINSQNI